MSFHFLLASMISDKKSAINLIEDTLYEMNWLFFTAVKVLSTSLSIVWLCVSWCEYLLVYPTWNLLSFLDVYINVFQQIWEVFSHYFFKCFLYLSVFSPPGTPIMHMLECLMVSDRSLRLSSFSWLFSFSFHSDWIKTG